MPSETPRLPQETYQKMLRRGASGGLGLQAGDVAEFPRRKNAIAAAIIPSLVGTLLFFSVAFVAIVMVAG